MRAHTTATCGCGDIADLSSRLKAVNAALELLNAKYNGPGKDEPLSPTSERDVQTAISKALTGANVGRLGTVLATMDRSSCAIAPSSGMSSCLSGALDAHFENQRDACSNWKNDPAHTGNDYRLDYTTGDMITDELTSYDNEKAFIESEIAELQTASCSRGETRNPSVQPPRNPSPVQPPINPVQPPINPPPVQPRSNPPTKQPPMPIAPLTRGSGYVEYILDGTMTFPQLGVFKMQADSKIPFRIDNGTITGQGTIITEFIPSDNCSVEGYDPQTDGRSDIKVVGRLTGNVMNVTFSPTSQNLGSNQGVTAGMKLTCKVGGAEGLAMNYPRPQRPYVGTQRLTLPGPGQQFTVANVEPPQANLNIPEFGNVFSTKITLKVYYHR